MTFTLRLERPGERSRRFLRWAQGFFLTIGTLALSYVAVTLLQARFYQELANKTLDQQMHAEGQHNVSLLRPQQAAKEGDVLGRIEIPRLGVSVAILGNLCTSLQPASYLNKL
jgi:sortase (surface protein transpeptidase)